MSNIDLIKIPFVYRDGLTHVGDVLVVELAIVVQAVRDVFSYRRVLQNFIQFF